MKDRAFIDTNIIIYLYSEDEPEKMNLSKQVFNKYDCITSTQVLSELSNVMLKKFSLSASIISKIVDEIINQCRISVVTSETVKKALDIVEKYKFSYYDSLIISAAIENSCKYLLTEDMQNTQIIDNSLEIKNIYTE
jgi:predicted nucleic acid-binding protein